MVSPTEQMRAKVLEGKSESYRTKMASPEFEQFTDTLTVREQGVIKARLRGESLEQIGRYLPNENTGGVGVTKPRVRQIEYSACRKIRSRIRAHRRGVLSEELV